MDSDQLSRAEAAALAGRSVDTISRWLREPGGPPYSVFRGRVRIPRGDFLKWLSNQVEPRRAQQ